MRPYAWYILVPRYDVVKYETFPSRPDDPLTMLADGLRGVAGVDDQFRMRHDGWPVVSAVVCNHEHAVLCGQIFGRQRPALHAQVRVVAHTRQHGDMGVVVADLRALLQEQVHQLEA